MRYAVIVVCLVLLPCLAFADTFTITDGSAFSSFFTLGLNVSGPNFRVNVGDAAVGSPFPPPVVPLQPYTFESRGVFGSGAYSFNGMPVSNQQLGLSNWSLVSSTVIPDGFTGGTLPGVATLTGLVRVGLESSTGPIFTDHTISGSGSAVFTFLTGAEPTRFGQVNVTFGSTGNGDISGGNGATPAPIPEPGTWLLLLTGLAGMRWYRRYQMTTGDNYVG